ncbi:MAG: hypothetical protein J1E57_06310 [Prevotella sp.]|nr:hypothetical protein [Prevotella sp.]
MRIKLLLMLIALIFISPIFGQNNSTKRVAILETVDKEGRVAYGVKLMVRSKLAYAITNTPGYEGYDRVDIASIMNEHDFQRTGLVSDAQIKRLGEMTGADYILVAEVANLDYSHIVIAAKILNVETARMEKTADTQTLSTADELESNCRILAGKLLNININTGAVKGELMIGKDKYVGEYRNGKPHGQGIIYYSIDDSNKRKYYEGDWVNGVREGNGTLVWNSGEKYTGAWKYVRNGYGTNYYANGEIYEGNWLNDKRHGNGKITFAKDDSSDRKYYDGDWLEGVRQGTGTMVWNNGKKYVGSWKHNLLYGKGIEYYTDGTRYEGNYQNGKRHGTGTFYWANGDYEDCDYQNGIQIGKSTYYFKDGRKRISYYIEGKKEGAGTFYFTDGRYVKEYWVNDKRHGEEKYYRSNGHHYMTKIYNNGVLKKTKQHK